MGRRNRLYFILRRLLSPAAALALLLLGVSLAVVYANRLYPLFFKMTSYPQREELLGYEVSLSAERQYEIYKGGLTRLRDIKISYPLAYESGGCELKYGAAIYDHEGVGRLYAGPGQTVYSHMRYLIKFKYDLKNKRCESKDLYVLSSDLPKSITIQLVNTRLGDGAIIEQPESRGIKISFERGMLPRMSVEPLSVAASDPFLPERTTPRGGKFSIPKPKEISPLIHPYESLNDFLIAEMKRRIESCRTTRVCDSVLAAVAKVTDRNFLRLAEEARSVGMPVEIISSHRYRLDQEADDFSAQGEIIQYSPWLWVRGSPYSKYGLGRLQMHTKFVIFGDDMVVSSNPSIRAGLRNASREYSLVYRDPDAVKIFKEIFTAIRTSLYYPVKVNMGDEALVLFNANRPRHYAVGAEKPYLAIDTDEGVRSSAYGILHEILSRSPDRLTVVMSPIRNSCAPYRIDRCLYGILGDRGRAGKLDLILNGYYFVPESKRVPPQDAGRAAWTRDALKEAASSSAAYRIFGDWAGRGSRTQLYMEYSRGLSTHHERVALIGEDLSVLGSANWGAVGTLNTLEVIRSKSLNRALAEEIRTFDEPWFVSERADDKPAKFRYGRCEFMFEVGAEPARRTQEVIVPARRITEELSRRYGDAPAGPLKIIEPEAPVGFERLSVRKIDLLDEAKLSASYNCVEDAQGRTYVVRTPIQ